MDEDRLNKIERAFVSSLEGLPRTRDAIAEMLKADIEHCTSAAARPNATHREVDLLLGRADQCKRVLRRMEM